jgi:hypothetical protein
VSENWKDRLFDGSFFLYVSRAARASAMSGSTTAHDGTGRLRAGLAGLAGANEAICVSVGGNAQRDRSVAADKNRRVLLAVLFLRFQIIAHCRAVYDHNGHSGHLGLQRTARSFAN